MSEDLRRRLDLASEAIRRLCRLDAAQWAAREQLFGPAEGGDFEWQVALLKKFVREKIVEVGHRRADKTPLYRVCREPDRFRALAVMSGILEDPSLIKNIVMPRPSSEPVTSVRVNPLNRPTRVMVEMPVKLYERLKARAEEKKLPVNDYLLALLAADGVAID